MFVTFYLPKSQLRRLSPNDHNRNSCSVIGLVPCPELWMGMCPTPLTTPDGLRGTCKRYVPGIFVHMRTIVRSRPARPTNKPNSTECTGRLKGCRATCKPTLALG